MTTTQAPKDTALREALTNAVQLLDALAGEGVGCEVADGSTLHAEDVCMDLAEALGLSLEDDAPTPEEIVAALLPAIEPDPSSSAQEVRAALTAALRFIRNTDDESGFGTQRMDSDVFYLQAFLLADRIEAALASTPPVRSNAEGDNG